MKPNWGGGATGALSGAATGASVGSFIPGIGTGIGAGVGGLIGGFTGLFGGGRSKESSYKQLPLYNEQQQQILSQLGGGVGALNQQSQDYISGILGNDPNSFAAYEDPIKQQYQQEVVPGLAERFSGLGARSSSAFNQTLARSGQDLSMKLAQQRAQLRDSAMQRLMQYNQLALTPQTMPYEKQGQQGWMEAFAPYAGDILASFASNYKPGGGTDPSKQPSANPVP